MQRCCSDESNAATIDADGCCTNRACPESNNEGRGREKESMKQSGRRGVGRDGRNTSGLSKTDLEFDYNVALLSRYLCPVSITRQLLILAIVTGRT